MRIGLADFVAGQFALPENPVMRGMGDFVNGQFAVPENPVLRGLGRVGNFVPSAPMWPIPQNSVITAWRGAGMSGLGCGGAKDDCGCGCSGGKGMGQVTLTTFTAPFTTAFTDIGAAFAAGSVSPLTTEDWMVILGSAAAFYYLFAKGGHR
jgi:hypothetical protein